MITRHQLAFIFLPSYGKCQSDALTTDLTLGRVMLRLLQSELTKNGTVDNIVLDQLCMTFEGAYKQAKASQPRPSKPEQQLFTVQELEWFSRNSYNLSLKHCAEISPQSLVRLLGVCAEVGDIATQQ
jgi:hypothetical protein